jgi:beta-barrel assembly-enhancing protease
MAQFFEVLQKKYGAGSAQFLSDHPNPGNRTEYIDKEVAGFVPRANYVTNTPEFTRIHTEAMSMRPYTSKEVASGIWKGQNPNQPVNTGADPNR